MTDFIFKLIPESVPLAALVALVAMIFIYFIVRSLNRRIYKLRNLLTKALADQETLPLLSKSFEASTQLNKKRALEIKVLEIHTGKQHESIEELKSVLRYVQTLLVNTTTVSVHNSEYSHHHTSNLAHRNRAVQHLIGAINRSKVELIYKDSTSLAIINNSNDYHDIARKVANILSE